MDLVYGATGRKYTVVGSLSHEKVSSGLFTWIFESKKKIENKCVEEVEFLRSKTRSGSVYCFL